MQRRSGTSAARLHGSCGRLIGADHRRSRQMLRNLGRVRHAVGLGILFLLRKVRDLILSLHILSTSGFYLHRSTVKCERGDSNPHGLLHWILSPARLPDSATSALALQKIAIRGKDFCAHPKKAPANCAGASFSLLSSFRSTCSPAGSRSSAHAPRLLARRLAG